MNGVQTRLKCKPNVKRCKRFVFAAHSPLLHPNTLKTKAIIHFQTDHILTRFVFPPLSVLNRYKVTHRGSKVAILALGSFYGLGQSVASLLKEKANIDATLINPRYITGVDNELMDELKADHELVITLEDGVLDGGFGEKITRYYGATNMKVLNFGAKKEFVDRYDIQEFLRANHLTDEQIVEDITAVIG